MTRVTESSGRARRIAYGVSFVVVMSSVGVSACGHDDGDDDGTYGRAGRGGHAGSAGRGGYAGIGGQAGSKPSAGHGGAMVGGSSGTAGEGGEAGTAGAAGSAGDGGGPEPEPPSLTTTTRARTVTLQILGGSDFDGDFVGYNVYREAHEGTGGGPLMFIQRTASRRFEDDHLALGQTYTYQVRQVRANGTEIQDERRSVTTTTLIDEDQLVRMPRLDVLVPIYRGGDTPFSDADVAGIKSGLELAREFYLRNSNGRLHLDVTYLEIPAEAPSTEGFTMVNIESDLRARGIIDNQYDLVYPIDDNLAGCAGGFVLLGQTAGAFGFVCPADFPLNDPAVNTTLIWSFVHEAQHAIDFVIAPSSGFDMLHGHPPDVYFPGYTTPVFDGAEQFDWQRTILRAFAGYDSFGTPHHGYIEADDLDRDRFADDDARLAADERRFGSLPTAADGDQDGLTDLGEFLAGTYAGSNPLVADTDSDGLTDDEDPTPRAPLPQTLPRCEVVVDGMRDHGYALYRRGLEFTNFPGFDAETWFCWSDEALHAYVEMNTEATTLIYVDGSGSNGFWQGGDLFGISLRPHLPAPFLSYDSRAEMDPGEEIAAGDVVTRVNDGITIVEARIPSEIGRPGFGFTGEVRTGFPTELGTVWGLRIVFGEFNGAGDMFSPPRAHQNDVYHFDDLTLVE